MTLTVTFVYTGASAGVVWALLAVPLRRATHASEVLRGVRLTCVKELKRRPL
jgi:hypothetical protein